MGLLRGMEQIAEPANFQADEKSLYIPPIILKRVKKEDAIMKEEVCCGIIYEPVVCFGYRLSRT
jgi:hypothetical protein